ncbi:hypothetical protein N431DRAFT_133426 [Stipitochalara longipes BDJ]|nr:hypothetical protein N431DRAFT_133426 [Stipitochalara longipes BDJ]
MGVIGGEEGGPDSTAAHPGAWRGLLDNQAGQLSAPSPPFDRSVDADLAGLAFAHALPKNPRRVDYQPTTSPLNRVVCLQTSWVRAYLLLLLLFAQSLSRSSFVTQVEGRKKPILTPSCSPHLSECQEDEKMEGQARSCKAAVAKASRNPMSTCQVQSTMHFSQSGGLRRPKLTSDK